MRAHTGLEILLGLAYSAFTRIFALNCLFVIGAQAQTDPLTCWNDGPTKQAVVTFVKETTVGTRSNPHAPLRHLLPSAYLDPHSGIQVVLTAPH
jgi:hypothetical protein